MKPDALRKGNTVGFTALVIDPAQTICEKLARTAASTELFSQIISCRNQRQAFDFLRKERIDMLLCDWRPETYAAGRDYFQTLKMRDEWADIPIFALTSEIDEEQQVLALESGADDCHCYPISPRKLAASMHHHLLRKVRTDELRSSRMTLARQAATDHLTGLYNRGFFNDSLEKEISRSLRSGNPFSLLLVDLDHFKAINDNFGHLMGDRVLQEVAAELKNGTRAYDLACRFGGEEFAIILPGAPVVTANKVAERLRRRICQLTDRLNVSGLVVSASIGISGWDLARQISARQLVDEADSALLEGKRGGRNRTKLFQKSRPMPCSEIFPSYLAASVGYA